MGRISEWFDRHMKTRIALQLVLDGLPALVMALHLLSGYPGKMLTSGWSGLDRIIPSTFYDVTLACLVLFPVPAFVASFLWRANAADLFDRYSWCRWISNGLRIVSVPVVFIAFLLDILLLSQFVIRVRIR